MRKLIALLPVVLAVSLIAGCSGDAEESPGSGGRTVVSEPTERPEPTESPDGRPTPADWLEKNVDQRPIPFDAERKRQMAEYSLSHYGKREWRLTDPKLIVIHFAVADTLDSIWSTFEGDSEHNGEPPNTCTHFAIDGTGKTIQMVDTSIRCRHVIGLNDVAIGIEHTGHSDADVLGDAEEMKASLRLVQALRCEYGLPVRAVIGHHETPDSPYFHADDPHADIGVHSDFNKESMDEYRARLRKSGPCSRRFASS